MKDLPVSLCLVGRWLVVVEALVGGSVVSFRWVGGAPACGLEVVVRYLLACQ